VAVFKDSFVHARLEIHTERERELIKFLQKYIEEETHIVISAEFLRLGVHVALCLSQVLTTLFQPFSFSFGLEVFASQANNLSSNSN